MDVPKRTNHSYEHWVYETYFYVHHRPRIALGYFLYSNVKMILNSLAKVLSYYPVYQY
jgi:hypothetical protein